MKVEQTAPAERMPVSAFVVCFNEEDQIAECLASLAFCDEIIAIDSFSSDRTVEIAKAHGAKVIQRAWPGYREQKAFGLSQVSSEWVINIDADERISPELQESILGVLKEEWQKQQHGVALQPDEQIVGYFISRVVFYLGRWWRLGGWYPEYRLRFFRRGRVTWGGVDPHEKVIPNGKTSRLDGEILHYTYASMAEQFEQLHRLSSFAAKEEFESGAKVTVAQILFNPLIRSIKFYLFKRGYREGMAGLIVAIAEGYYTFMKYAKLWEFHFNARNANKDIGPGT